MKIKELFESKSVNDTVVRKIDALIKDGETVMSNLPDAHGKIISAGDGHINVQVGRKTVSYPVPKSKREKLSLNQVGSPMVYRLTLTIDKTGLKESRFGEELDGWYVLDKATDAVVAGPFDSKDEAQKKTMRPPMFANHHRYKIKAFGEALKESTKAARTYLAFIDPDQAADWDAIAVFDTKAAAAAQAKIWKSQTKGTDSRVEQHRAIDGTFVTVVVDYAVPDFDNSGVIFVCAADTRLQATETARQLISSGSIMGVDNLDDLAIMPIRPVKLVKEDLGKPVEVQIEKGLTREEAMKKAPYKKSYGDCRAFSYDKKTGIATWV